MDFNVSQNLTLTPDSAPLELFSSQADDLDEFLALFDSPCANTEPLDATEFAKAQDPWMVKDFHNMQNWFKELAHGRSSGELYTDDQDQSSSVISGVVTEESSGEWTPSHLVLDGSTAIDNTDGAVVLETNALSLSQVTALEIEPMSPERPGMAMTQVTAFEIRPKVPQMSVLVMSQVTTLDLKPMSPDTSTTITSPIKTLNSSHIARKTPMLDTSQAVAFIRKPTSTSTTEAAAATHTLSSGASEGSRSRTERMKGLLNPFDHPIVVCDGTADEELKRKLAEQVDQPIADMDRCNELQWNKQPYLQRTTGRMRSKPEREGVVEWVQYEQNVLNELQDACHSHVAYWKQVRDMPDLAMNARVQQHDTLVRGFVEIARDKGAVLPTEVDELRKSYMELQRQIMPKVEKVEGEPLLKQLSQALDVVYNRSEIAHTIRPQRKMHSNKKDGNYRPSKRQKRL